MDTKSDSDGIPAEVVIAKLEAKLQAELDRRGFRRCDTCHLGILRPDVRDVAIDRQGQSIVVPNIHAYFCDRCGAIEFNDHTDSAKRYAVAVDKLAFRNRASEMWRSLNARPFNPKESFMKTLWHAAREAWRSFFAPVRMVMWLLDPRITNSQEPAKALPGHIALPLVTVCWDPEARVWVAASKDFPGLVTEAADLDGLEAKLKIMILELLAMNKVQLPNARFRLIFGRDVSLFPNDTPGYPLDEGPLSEEYLAGLRADVERNFPRGKLNTREDLFK